MSHCLEPQIKHHIENGVQLDVGKNYLTFLLPFIAFATIINVFRSDKDGDLAWER